MDESPTKLDCAVASETPNIIQLINVTQKETLFEKTESINGIITKITPKTKKPPAIL